MAKRELTKNRRRIVRKGPGSPPKTELRQQYIQLMKQGYGNSEACRIVGVNRKTGHRWRHGRVVKCDDGRTRSYAPVSEPVVISARYLSAEERVVIADGLRAGESIRAIAKGLGRSPSTVSREVRRNRNPRTCRYEPFTAGQKAARRRPRPKPGKLATNPKLREYVQARLNERWSPEQIANALAQKYQGDSSMQIVHETIYQALYRPTTGPFPRMLARRALRTGRWVRKRRRRRDARRTRFPDSASIKQRPTTVNDRVEPGHWEGDLIMGELNRSAIGTLVERTTRTTILVHLPDGKTAEPMRDALIEIFADIPEDLKRTLTWDQGSEMALHHEFSQATEVPVFFCNRASPWQRGSNENGNGLLRQYFPKGTDLTVHSREFLDEVAAELNHRPRKVLGHMSPVEAMSALLV